MTQPKRKAGGPVISASRVSKKFCRDLRRTMLYGLGDVARELTGRGAGGGPVLRPAEFWALHDVSFDVREGSTFGLIGHNGSGKTTLLKCIAGILRPTSGTIRQRGRLAALLELGAGFHPELTGRENVYLNASFLGLTPEALGCSGACAPRRAWRA